MSYTPTVDTLRDVVFTSLGQGDLFFRGATNWINLAADTAGHVLTTNGPGADPTWTDPAVNGVILAPATSARNLIQPTVDTATPLTLKAHSPTQSARLLEWQDSTGGLLGGVGPGGSLIMKGFATSVAAKTASYVAVATDSMITVDATSGPVTITLPAANVATPFGLHIRVVKSDSSANAVTISRAGADTINGGTTFTLTTQYGQTFLQSDGVSAWNAVPLTVSLSPNSVTRNTIQPAADVNKGLVIKSFSATQSANLFEAQDDTGTLVSFISPTQVALGPSSATSYIEAGNPGATIVPVISFAGTSNTNGATNRALGAYIGTKFSGNAPPRPMRVYGEIPSTNSTAYTNFVGMTFALAHLGSGAITDINGISSGTTINNAAAVVTTARGFQAQSPIITAGVLGTYKGFEFQGMTASPTTSYGVHIQSAGRAAITTSYGIALDNQTGATTSYAIYSAGGQNVFLAGAAAVVPLTLQGAASQSANLFQIQDSAAGLLMDVTSAGDVEFRRKDSTTEGVIVGNIVGAFNSNTHATYTGRITLSASDASGTRECIRLEGDGTNARLGFLGAAAVARAAAYTLTGTATRTFPTDPSSAYTGIDNLQAGTPYAQLTDLNTLRTAVSTLIGIVRQMATDLGNASGYGLLNA